MRRLLLLVASLSVSGCVTLEAMSSGEVGCPPEQITVTDQQSSLGGRTWTAQCEGRTYYCSLHGGEGSQTSCTPEGGSAPGGSGSVPPEPGGAATTAPAEAGCTYDQQCKGDRICEEGVCVDPPVAATPPPADPEPAPPPPEPPEAAAPPAG